MKKTVWKLLKFNEEIWFRHVYNINSEVIKQRLKDDNTWL